MRGAAANWRWGAVGEVSYSNVPVWGGCRRSGVGVTADGLRLLALLQLYAEEKWRVELGYAVGMLSFATRELLTHEGCSVCFWAKK